MTASATAPWVQAPRCGGQSQYRGELWKVEGTTISDGTWQTEGIDLSITTGERCSRAWSDLAVYCVCLLRGKR